MNYIYEFGILFVASAFILFNLIREFLGIKILGLLNQFGLHALIKFQHVFLELELTENAQLTCTVSFIIVCVFGRVGSGLIK